MDDDSAAVRSLAERLLVHMIGMEDGPLERARLNVSALPDDLPCELPIPPGATVVGSAVAPAPWAGPGRTETRVILELPVDPDAAVAAVRETAGPLGWSTLDSPGQPEMGGFVSWPERSRHLTLCRGRRGPALDVGATLAVGGGSELRMTLRGDDGLCGDYHGLPGVARALPTLRPPAGVWLRGESGGGGGGSWTSTAIIDGETPVGDLVAHFTRQMEAVGWSVAGGEIPEPISVWTRGEGWTATLAVVALPAGGGLGPRRWLMLRVDAVDAVDVVEARP